MRKHSKKKTKSQYCKQIYSAGFYGKIGQQG